MEMMLELIPVIIALVVFTAGAWCGVSVNNEYWVKLKKPHCEESTAMVHDKSVTLKRCWKVVEIE